MKFISKFALLSLIISSSIYSSPNIPASTIPSTHQTDLYFAREIYKAATKTAQRKKSVPAIVKQIINTPFKSFTSETLNQASNNFTLDDIGFIFESAVERFVDETNQESMSEHVDFFTYVNRILRNKAPQVSNFLAKVENLKSSTDAKEILKTMKAEMEILHASLCRSKVIAERKVADSIKKDLDAMLDQKGRVALGSILCTRALKNRKK
jgi:hypothetical protein